MRQAVHLTEAGLDGGDHEVLDVLALDAFRRRDEAQGLSVAAVESESHADLLMIIAADLEAVGAPSEVRAVDRDAPVVATGLVLARMALKEKAVMPHDAVDALVVGCGEPLGPCLTPQDGIVRLMVRQSPGSPLGC